MSESSQPMRDPAASEVRQLLSKCLATPADERPALLDHLCRRHPDLAGALRERLELLERVGFVDDSPPRAKDPSVCMPERLGGYRLLERLGHGGMGVVYLAEQESLGRRVALKVIQTGAMASPRARERFRREVQAISLLDHPNICPVYDAGEIDGVPYFAMRYVEGETMEARIERERKRAGSQAGSATDAEAIQGLVTMGQQLARALHAAHEKGLIHRDVKPGNVMLEAATGRPLLLDFGLARLDDGDTPTLTLSGDRLGTPAYMAPEQVAGLDADRRTDVYALGATLYEALTGRLPHEAPTREALYRRILSSELTPAGRHNSRIPRDLDIVLATALDREPNRRYATAADFAADLGRVLRREPILARPLGPWLRARRWCQRNRVASGVLATLLLGLGASSYLLVRLNGAMLRQSVALKVAEADGLGDRSPRQAALLVLQAHTDAPGPETLRGLHRHVARDHEHARCKGHNLWLWTARFSPDGQRVVTSSDDVTCRIWSTDGRELAQVKGNHDACFSPVPGLRQIATATESSAIVWSEAGNELYRFDHPDDQGIVGVRYAPDGDRLLVLSNNGQAWLWTPTTGDSLPLEDHRGDWLRGGAFSPDGQLCATSMCWGVQVHPQFDDYDVRVWNVADGTVRARLPHDDEVPTVVFGRGRGESTRILTACFDRTAKLWTRDGELVRTFKGHEKPLQCANFSPDERLVVSGSNDGTARLWDVETGACLQVMRHHGFVMAAEFSPDGRRVLTADTSGLAHLWDLHGRPLAKFRGHGGLLLDAEFSPDGRFAVTASSDGTARIWRVQDDKLPRRAGSVSGVRSLAAGPKALPGVLAAAGWDHVVRVWEPGLAEPRRFVLEPEDREDRVRRVLFDASGDHLIVAHDHHWVTIWRRTDAREPRARIDLRPRTPFPASRQRAQWAFRDCSVAMLPDGHVLITSQYGRVLVVDLDGNRIGPDFETNQEIVCVAVHPDGTCFAIGTWGTMARSGPPRASASQGRLVQLYDLQGQPLGPPLVHHGGRVTGVAFSRDGRYLASASDDGTGRLWDLQSDHPPVILEGHNGELSWVGFSPTDDLLATTSRDGTARLWNLSGELITAIDVAEGSILAGAFSADGRYLYTSTETGLVFTWMARPQDLAALARERAVEPR